MSKVFKKGDKISQKKRFDERSYLQSIFVKEYGSPVIVHAVNDPHSFKSILKQGELKLPNNHKFPKKCPYLAEHMGLDNTIFFSLGFIYATAYKFKFNLIFSLNLVKELKLYRKSLFSQCYREVVEYWIKKDSKYLKKLENHNKLTKEVIHNYFHKEYSGKIRKVFEFWRIEKIVFDFIQNYPQKKKLVSIIKKTEKELFSRYPNSRRLARKYALNNKVPEMISRKNVVLQNNPNFLGFYILGKPTKEQLKLIQRYPNKIYFDGKKIREISNLKIFI